MPVHGCQGIFEAILKLIFDAPETCNSGICGRPISPLSILRIRTIRPNVPIRKGASQMANIPVIGITAGLIYWFITRGQA